MKKSLRRQLREEANSVKDCFTTFAFQGLAFSTIVLGAIASYQPEQALAGLASVLVIVVLLTVSRIGNYKYATANRHFAYELYCDTTDDEAAHVGWEEALRAWRVIQATLFDEIYTTRRDYRRRSLRRLIARNRIEIAEGRKCKEHPGWWFDVKAQLTAPAQWHPGRYLFSMHVVLHIVTWLAIIPLVGMALQLANDEYDHLRIVMGRLDVTLLAAWSFALAVVVGVRIRTSQINARREILEDGMLSIASSAVVWEVVIAAHRVAERRSGGKEELYLPTLGQVAGEVASGAGCIWHWLNAARREFRGEELSGTGPNVT